MVVGISGASGAPYALRLLQVLKDQGIPTHLVISKSAARALKEEAGLGVSEVRALAAANYSNHDLGAAIASGSFRTRGMIVMPCSIRTLSDVAYRTLS